MLPRIYLPRQRLQPELSLPEDTAHYLRVVLRLGPGAEFVAFTGDGGEYRARLTPGGAEVIEQLPPRQTPDVRLTLYQGLPKGKRWPLILQKCTELGVSEIVPVLTRRSVVRLEQRELADKQQRWQKIAVEAAEQSQGLAPPQVGLPVSWGDALGHWRASERPGLLLDETLAGEPGHHLREALAPARERRELAVFVGPEGGFAPEESLSGREAGLTPVSLGARILRTETAAIVISALVMYELGALE